MTKHRVEISREVTTERCESCDLPDGYRGYDGDHTRLCYECKEMRWLGENFRRWMAMKRGGSKWGSSSFWSHYLLGIY